MLLSTSPFLNTKLYCMQFAHKFSCMLAVHDIKSHVHANQLVNSMFTLLFQPFSVSVRHKHTDTQQDLAES